MTNFLKRFYKYLLMDCLSGGSALDTPVPLCRLEDNLEHPSSPYTLRQGLSFASALRRTLRWMTCQFLEGSLSSTSHLAAEVLGLQTRDKTPRLFTWVPGIPNQAIRIAQPEQSWGLTIVC